MEEEGRSAGLVVRLGASAAELGSARGREGAPQTSGCGGTAGGGAPQPDREGGADPLHPAKG